MNFDFEISRVDCISKENYFAPRVAQRYGTIAAHTRRRASVLVVFVVFLGAHAQFCRFDKAESTADVQ